MATLTLDYRCCDRKCPLYIKHIEVSESPRLRASNWSQMTSIPFLLMRCARYLA